MADPVLQRQKLIRQSTMLVDFHMEPPAVPEEEGFASEEEPGSNKTSKQGGDSSTDIQRRGSRASGTGGDAGSRAVTAASGASRQSADRGGGRKAHVARIEEDTPSFLRALRNAWKDCTTEVHVDTDEYIGKLQNVSADKFLDPDGQEVDVEFDLMDAHEEELMRAVSLARHLAAAHDEAALAKGHDLFRAIDVNDSGFIDVNELSEAFRTMKLHPTRDQLNYLLTKYDENGDGEIEFEEFRCMYVELAELHLEMVREQKRQLKALFSELDVADSGKISMDELRKMFDDLPKQPSDEQLRLLVEGHLKADAARANASTAVGGVAEAFHTGGEESPLPRSLVEGIRGTTVGNDFKLTFRMFTQVYEELDTLHKSMGVEDAELEQLWIRKLGEEGWKASIGSEWGETFRDPEKLRQVFSSLEERNDSGDRLGYVANGSLGKLFDLMDYSISKDEVKDLVAKYDRNGRGFIDFPSFQDLSNDLAQVFAERRRSSGSAAKLDPAQFGSFRAGTPSSRQGTATSMRQRSRAGKDVAGGGPLTLDSESGSFNTLDDASFNYSAMAEKLEDLSRSAVVGLPSQIRNLLSESAKLVVGSPWFALSWVQRYLLARNFTPNLKGGEKDKYGAVLSALPDQHKELEDLLNDVSQDSGFEMPQKKILLVEQTGSTNFAQQDLCEVFANPNDKGQDVLDLKQTEAKSLVLTYSLKVRQMASEEAGWESGQEWRGKLNLCRSVTARLTQGLDRKSQNALDNVKDITLDAVGKFWGGDMTFKTANAGAKTTSLASSAPQEHSKNLAIGGARMAKIINGMKFVSQDKGAKAGHEKRLGKLLGGATGSSSRRKKKTGGRMIALMEEDDGSGTGGLKSVAVDVLMAQQATRAVAGMGASKKKVQPQGSLTSLGSPTLVSPSNKSPTNRSRGASLLLGGSKSPLAQPVGKKKETAASKALRAEKLAKLKKTAMKVNVGVRLASMAKGAHEKILSELFRDALMKPSTERTNADLKVMAKLFKVCPQLVGLPNDKLFKFCQLVSCQVFKDGEPVVQEGAESNAYYVIAVGFAKVLVRSGTDSDSFIEVSKLGPGRAFGELGIIYDQPRSATVVSDGNLIAAKVERDDYMELLSDFHVQKLFQRIQNKLDFIRRFKAWKSYDLRPQFALTYLFQHAEAPDGTVLYDAETMAFDHRYFEDKERYVPRDDGVIHFLQVGMCEVYAQARYTLWKQEEEDMICVSVLSPGCFFGGPATPSNISKIVAKGKVEVFECGIEDLLLRMGPDIVSELRAHCKTQEKWVGDRVQKWCEGKLEAGETGDLLKNAARSRKGHKDDAATRLPSMEMKQIGGYSGRAFEVPKVGRAISRPHSRGNALQMPLHQHKVKTVPHILSAISMLGSVSHMQDEGEMDVHGWVSHLERKEDEVNRKRMSDAKNKLSQKRRGTVMPPTVLMQELLAGGKERERGGAASVDPAGHRAEVVIVPRSASAEPRSASQATGKKSVTLNAVSEEVAEGGGGGAALAG